MFQYTIVIPIRYILYSKKIPFPQKYSKEAEVEHRYLKPVFQALLRLADPFPLMETALEGHAGTHNSHPQQRSGFTVCFLPASPVMQLRIGQTLTHSPLPSHLSGAMNAFDICFLMSWIAPVGQTAAQTPRLSHFALSQTGTPFFIVKAPLGHFLTQSSQEIQPTLHTDVTALPFSGLLQATYVLVV